MIFPLPLSPLEYYFWCDDTPDYPTTFPIELTFSGKVDPDAFEQALTATVGRHPLLSATIDAGGVWPHWVETSPRIHFDWNDSDTPVTHPQGEHLDLTSSPGMRTWIREGSEQTKVYFQFHHTCVDGLAVQQFVEDMLVQYCLNIGAGNDRTRLRGLDQRQLLRRHACCRSLREGLKQPLQRLRDAVDMVWEWHKIMNRRPAVLAECRDSDSFLDRQANVDGASGCLRQSKPTHRLLDFSTHTLDGDQVRRLKRIATDNHVSANDLLVSDMFRAMRNWNVRHRPQDDQANPWLSISIPANERQLADRSMPAANRLGMAFLSRRVNQCAAGSALLSSVHKEMETIRRRHRGRCFLRGLSVGSQFQSMIPWFLNRPRSFATVCVSNVGRVFGRTPLPRRQKRLVCGDAVLEQVTGTPFVRRHTRAAVTIVNYANEMTINLRSDPSYFDAAERASFLDSYIGLVETTIASPNAALAL